MLFNLYLRSDKYVVFSVTDGHYTNLYAWACGELIPASSAVELFDLLHARHLTAFTGDIYPQLKARQRVEMTEDEYYGLVRPVFDEADYARRIAWVKFAHKQGIQLPLPERR